MQSFITGISIPHTPGLNVDESDPGKQCSGCFRGYKWGRGVTAGCRGEKVQLSLNFCMPFFSTATGPDPADSSPSASGASTPFSGGFSGDISTSQCITSAVASAADGDGAEPVGRQRSFSESRPRTRFHLAQPPLRGTVLLPLLLLLAELGCCSSHYSSTHHSTTVVGVLLTDAEMCVRTSWAGAFIHSVINVCRRLWLTPYGWRGIGSEPSTANGLSSGLLLLALKHGSDADSLKNCFLALSDAFCSVFFTYQSP